MESGGFPEVLDSDRSLRVRIHQEYWNSMLFRDVIERHDLAHPKALIQLAHWLAENVASLYSVNRITGYLKALGYHVPKASVSEYLEWFEDAYIFFSVRIFDVSLARTNTNPKKIYAIDHALVQSITSGIMVNSGRLLENFVFTVLRRRTSKIFYVKTKKGKEVDFLALGVGRHRMLVQVCETLVDASTRQRELSALWAAMAELKLDEGFVVTREENEIIRSEVGSIYILPAWKFALRGDDALGT